MGITNRVDELFDFLVKIRRDLHMHPEIGMEEHRTSLMICKSLEQWGIEYEKGIAKTGIVGMIRGKKKGKTVALRADMDALPLQEENEISYKSIYDGKMHACGHDVHTTILLGAAKILKDMEEEFNGNIKLFFQPAEETIGGALQMINSGCMENPKVDYVIGLHVMPHIKAGEIEIKYGKMYACADYFKIIIKGKSGHGAMPHTGIDAVLIASHVVTALQQIISRNINPTNAAVLSIGRINGGTKSNIIADKVVLEGTIRMDNTELRKVIRKRIKNIVENVSNSFGGEGIVEIIEGYKSLANDNEVIDIIKNNGKELLGDENINYIENICMGVEDFAYFSDEAKGGFYHLGCSNKIKGITHELHNNKFDVDEKCIKIGVLLQVKNALSLLENS